MKKAFSDGVLLFLYFCLSYSGSAQNCYSPTGGCGDIYTISQLGICTPVREVTYCASYDFSVINFNNPPDNTQQVQYQWYYNTTAVGTNSPQYTSPVLHVDDSVWVVISGACNLTKKVYARSVADVNGLYYYLPAASPPLNPNPFFTYCARNKLNVLAKVYDKYEASQNTHYKWKLNDIGIGADAPTCPTPVLKYNDKLTVTVTSPLFCSTTVNFLPQEPMFFIWPADNQTNDESLALKADIPLIETPLSMHWMINGHEATNVGLGGEVGDGNLRYTELRFSKAAIPANHTQIWVEINGADQCARPGMTTFQTVPYLYTRPGDGGNDITAISVKRFKTPTDSLITAGMIKLADTTVTFNININDGYGNAPVVDKISMTTKAKYYPFWTKVGFPTTVDLLNVKPILQTHIATNGDTKIWKIFINLNNGPAPGTTTSTRSGN